MFDRCKLKAPRRKQKETFSDFEYDQILYLILEKKYNNSLRECCIHSSFYRIINITKVIKKIDQSWKDCLFYLYDYLTELENKVFRSILNISNVSNEEAENFIKFYIREQNLNGGESIHECLERLKLRKIIWKISIFLTFKF